MRNGILLLLCVSEMLCHLFWNTCGCLLGPFFFSSSRPASASAEAPAAATADALAQRGKKILKSVPVYINEETQAGKVAQSRRSFRSCANEMHGLDANDCSHC